MSPSLQTYTDTRRNRSCLGGGFVEDLEYFRLGLKRSGHKKGAQVQPQQPALRASSGKLPLRPSRPLQLSRGKTRVSDKIYTTLNKSYISITVASLLLV